MRICATASRIWERTESGRNQICDHRGVRRALVYKQAYINAKEEDIVITKSPVGMPGRAIMNPFLKKMTAEGEKVTRCFRCLEHCDPANIPYCITQALINAAQGDEDRA